MSRNTQVLYLETLRSSGFESCLCTDPGLSHQVSDTLLGVLLLELPSACPPALVFGTEKRTVLLIYKELTYAATIFLIVNTGQKSVGVGPSPRAFRGTDRICPLAQLAQLADFPHMGGGGVQHSREFWKAHPAFVRTPSLTLTGVYKTN